MDQGEAPVLEALAIVERDPITGFGGPGHNMGADLDPELVDLLGRQVFRADVLTPKGLDDRAETAQVVQRASALAAEAWGGTLCRFVTGGSTQALQIAINALAGPGETVLIARNAHRAGWNAAINAGVALRPVPVAVDAGGALEHGIEPATLARMLDENPEARAVLAVSPSFYGVVADIPALAAVCHARGVPLLVDSAWGAAFGFCDALPEPAIRAGADIMVTSVHKTMGALAQGSVLLAGGDLVDPGRVVLAYESFRTTSPSVPLLASLDAARRRHARIGDRLWRAVLGRAADARARLAPIGGIRVRDRELLGSPSAIALDETKLLLSFAALGITGFQADDWLQRERRVSLVLADRDHLLAVFGVGTTDADVDRLVDAVGTLAEAARRGDDPSLRPPALPIPSVATLGVEFAMPPGAAFHAPFEVVPLAAAAGRIAAELVGPSPPEVPRLVPGQRIGPEHVAFLLACREGGAYLPDPTGRGGDRIRVVR